MSYDLKSVFATLPRTTRGVPIVLGKDPKGKNFLYTNRKSVIIRDIANPSLSDIYTQHSAQCTVAQYAPSGFYIASGDTSGKIRIWDTINKEHILKNEFQPMGGAIKDIAWTEDSKRIATVGEGRERFGHVFAADTGTSVGSIMGQSKPLNSCEFKPNRPYRLVTASEDKSVAFFEGPPFKFISTKTDHTNFANAVRYAPDGSVFISGGADGKAFVYDGKTSDKVAELGGPAHKGGIYALSFSPDSKRLLTVSGDKTAKIWDVGTTSVIQEYVMGKEVMDQQVGCLWQGDFILTVSLSGYINYLDQNNTAAPYRVIKGHNNPITALQVSDNKSTAYTASSSGEMCYWNLGSGECDIVGGKGHTNMVSGLVVAGDNVVTCGMDDTVIFTSDVGKQYGEKVKMPSEPKGVASNKGGLTVVACVREVVVLRDRRVVFSVPADYAPTCVDINVDGSQVAVGGSQDAKVHVYSVGAGDALTESTTLTMATGVCDVKYSPDGAYMAACDLNRRISLFKLPDYSVKISSEWTHHNARVTSLDWAASGQYLASGAIDTMACVWSPDSKFNYMAIKGEHPMALISKVAWVDNNTLLTAADDCCLRRFTLTHTQ